MATNGPPKDILKIENPYLNRTLHAGHGSTISKIEFAAGYERMCGKRALFPMEFHCTGMAINTCADKLKREVEMFGQDFERYEEVEGSEQELKPTEPCQAKQMLPCLAREGASMR
ncbi:cytosolic leucyl tRNA synthetase [Aspergillus hancockii]|nr:cytosolic leucyl tRNA synthetase [Aspergillus hancockii]